MKTLLVLTALSREDTEHQLACQPENVEEKYKLPPKISTRLPLLPPLLVPYHKDLKMYVPDRNAVHWYQPQSPNK